MIYKPQTHEGNTVIRFAFLCDVNQQPDVSGEHQYTYLTIDELEELENRGLICGKEMLPLLKKVLSGSEPDINDVIQVL